MTTVTALLTNRAYGYPTRGAARRRRPTVLAVLHQTANSHAEPMDERNYANRPAPRPIRTSDRCGRAALLSRLDQVASLVFTERTC